MPRCKAHAVTECHCVAHRQPDIKQLVATLLEVQLTSAARWVLVMPQLARGAFNMPVFTAWQAAEFWALKIAEGPAALVILKPRFES